MKKITDKQPSLGAISSKKLTFDVNIENRSPKSARKKVEEKLIKMEVKGLEYKPNPYTKQNLPLRPMLGNYYSNIEQNVKTLELIADEYVRVDEIVESKKDIQ
jgi:hypothetical protein